MVALHIRSEQPLKRRRIVSGEYPICSPIWVATPIFPLPVAKVPLCGTFSCAALLAFAALFPFLTIPTNLCRSRVSSPRRAGLALLAVRADDFGGKFYWGKFPSSFFGYVQDCLVVNPNLLSDLPRGWKLSATPHINSADFSFNGGDGLGMWIVIVSSYAQIELWK